MRYEFGGLIFRVAYTWRDLFSEFYGILLKEKLKGDIYFFFFLQTGQETTSAMLAFMLAEVGKHPEVEER